MARLGLDAEDIGPNDRLGHTAAAHFARGYRFEQNGNFDDALKEYRVAIDNEPGNSEARNNFAYTVYRWHLSALRAPGLKIPDPLWYESARRYAEEAVRLTENTKTQVKHRVMQSTVGEIELASGNPGIALKVLRESLVDDAADPTGITHPFFDEIRWDLAQAYMCTGDTGKAKQQVQLICEEERGREDQRFVGPPDDGFIDRNLKVLKADCAYFQVKR